ncbi:MAG TPA: GrpB family protein [Vicinamibacteria bacterium]|nr:GrpB family protein [Vicinamibacteria bacterium]
MTGALGLESGLVRLVEYDARWPALFDAEARRLREACAGLPLRLEHIGSTAVSGLCAKPVLDILAGRPADVPANRYIARLHSAGYEHRGERGVPGREYFHRGDPRAYHVHLVVENEELWRDYLAFRDRLRADVELKRRYAELKRSLAARFPRNREAYMEGKAAFVDRALRDSSGA